MNRSAMYKTIYAKIAAMSAQLLTAEDYKQLIAMNSTGDIAGYLKNNTVYGPLFREMDPGAVHRSLLEEILKERVILAAGRLIHYLDGDYKKFIRGILMKNEIRELKTVARRILIEKDVDRITEGCLYLAKNQKLDLNKLEAARSIRELIDALEGTVYFNFLKNVRDEAESGSLFHFEMALDKAYFSILGEYAEHLAPEDRKAFIEIYGSITDMLNIQLIYRGKRYFDLPPDVLFNYSLPFGNRLPYKKVLALCYSKDWQDLQKIVQDTPYGFLLKGDDKQDIYMERRMNRYLYYRLRSRLKRSSDDISPLFAFLELLELEVKDITAIIENVKYGLDLDIASTYLIKAV